MTTQARLSVLRLSMTAVAGASLGFGLSGLPAVDFPLAMLIVALALVGEWLEVRPGPVGSFTLRPAAVFVGLWTGGPALMMFAAVVPCVLVRVTLGRSTLRDAFSIAGQDVIGFWLGYGAFTWMSAHLAASNLAIWLSETVAQLASFVAFWCGRLYLQAVVTHLEESIRYRVIWQSMLRSAWTHLAIQTAGAVFLVNVGSSFGLIVMGLGAVMLVEAYYPWKLLAEQTGILFTSLQMMAQAVDLKDPYTSRHSYRVAEYAVRIARTIGLPELEVDRIRIGALMHDIGKIGVSGRVIRKPSRLDDDERLAMMRHSSMSADVIGSLSVLQESAKMVRHHHERWDGGGYPDGLVGDEIPLGARIIFVADALDALTSDRPYRRGRTKAEALAIIRENAGTQFDSNIVEALGSIFHLL